MHLYLSAASLEFSGTLGSRATHVWLLMRSLNAPRDWSLVSHCIGSPLSLSTASATYRALFQHSDPSDTINSLRVSGDGFIELWWITLVYNG